MDKNEFTMKLEEIDVLAERGDFEGAAAAADTVDWRKVKNLRTLCTVAEIYEACRRYDDSLAILQIAYKKSGNSKSVVYRLAEMYIRVGNFDEAERSIREYKQLSPHDMSRYILLYKLARAKKVPLDDQIAILRTYKDREYTERWAFELARLYHQNGQDERCVSECDDMILWFAQGKYVLRAMDLKRQIQPLTKEQEALYNKEKNRIRMEAEAAEAARLAKIRQEEEEAKARELKAKEEAEAKARALEEQRRREEALREAEELNRVEPGSTLAAIDKLDAVADQAVAVSAALANAPNVAMPVRQAFQDEPPTEEQEMLASSIREVFADMRGQANADSKDSDAMLDDLLAETNNAFAEELSMGDFRRMDEEQTPEEEVTWDAKEEPKRDELEPGETLAEAVAAALVAGIKTGDVSEDISNRAAGSQEVSEESEERKEMLEEPERTANEAEREITENTDEQGVNMEELSVELPENIQNEEDILSEEMAENAEAADAEGKEPMVAKAAEEALLSEEEEKLISLDAVEEMTVANMEAEEAALDETESVGAVSEIKGAAVLGAAGAAAAAIVGGAAVLAAGIGKTAAETAGAAAGAAVEAVGHAVGAGTAAEDAAVAEETCVSETDRFNEEAGAAEAAGENRAAEAEDFGEAAEEVESSEESVTAATAAAAATGLVAAVGAVVSEETDLAGEMKETKPQDMPAFVPLKGLDAGDEAVDFETLNFEAVSEAAADATDEVLPATEEAAKTEDEVLEAAEAAADATDEALPATERPAAADHDDLSWMSWGTVGTEEVIEDGFDFSTWEAVDFIGGSGKESTETMTEKTETVEEAEGTADTMEDLAAAETAQGLLTEEKNTEGTGLVAAAGILAGGAAAVAVHAAGAAGIGLAETAGAAREDLAGAAETAGTGDESLAEAAGAGLAEATGATGTDGESLTGAAGAGLTEATGAAAAVCAGLTDTEEVSGVTQTASEEELPFTFFGSEGKSLAAMETLEEAEADTAGIEESLAETAEEIGTDAAGIEESLAEAAEEAEADAAGIEAGLAGKTEEAEADAAGIEAGLAGKAEEAEADAAGIEAGLAGKAEEAGADAARIEAGLAKTAEEIGADAAGIEAGLAGKAEEAGADAARIEAGLVKTAEEIGADAAGIEESLAETAEEAEAEEEHGMAGAGIAAGIAGAAAAAGIVAGLAGAAAVAGAAVGVSETVAAAGASAGLSDASPAAETAAGEADAASAAEATTGLADAASSVGAVAGLAGAAAVSETTVKAGADAANHTAEPKSDILSENGFEFVDFAEDETPETSDADASGKNAKQIDDKAFVEEILGVEKRPVEPRPLDATETELLSYFARIPGIPDQVTKAMADVYNNSGGRTSNSGNILIMGRPGCGKSRLAEGMILAMGRDLGIQAVKSARLTAQEMNQKDAATVIGKMAGGFLVIEAAGSLRDDVVENMSGAMEFRTDGLVIILEDERKELKKMLARHPIFARKFTSEVVVPVFTNDELVMFAKTYAKERGYKLDEMAVLALYTEIGENQRDEEPVTVGMVRMMIDRAINRTASHRFGRRRAVDTDGRILLREKDFDY